MKHTVFSFVLSLYLFIGTGFFLSFNSSSNLQAQDLGNGWIEYDKTHYKFKLVKEGIYRIYGNTLSANGINGKGSDIRLFNKGREIPVYISTDNALGSNDYIEFYGKKNDGEFDAQLYAFPSWQLNEEISLFNDTAAYYLVVDEGGAEHQRFDILNNDISNVPDKEEYYWHKERVNYKSAYNAGVQTRLGGVNNSLADFENGEGWVGLNFFININKSKTISLPAAVTDKDKIKLTIKVTGQSNNLTEFNDHPINIKVNDFIVIDTTYEGYRNEILTDSFPASLIDENNNVKFEFVALDDETTIVNNNAVAYIQVDYLRYFDALNENKFSFRLQNDSDKYIEIENLTGGNTATLYDISTGKRWTIDKSNDNLYKIHILKDDDAEDDLLREFLIIHSEDAITNINDLKTLNFTDYSLTENQGNYLIIYHPKLTKGSNPVEKYRNYRSSTEGGSHQVVTANIEELYDQFSWGIGINPMAIRNFVNYSFANWDIKPKLMLLAGKSVRYDQSRNNPLAHKDNLVPTYGVVGSDNMLCSPTILSYRPQLGIGRIPARTTAELQAYLDKIIEYEAIQQTPECLEENLWMKNALHIAGGNNLSQSNDFIETLNKYKILWEDIHNAGKVVYTYNKLNEDPIDQAAFFKEYMDNGLAMIHFIGHSANTLLNVDIGSPENYENYGKYPFMITGSCNVGDLHNEIVNTRSMPEDYILADGLGCIGFLATSSTGFPNYLDLYCDNFYRQFCIENYNKTVGSSIKNTVIKIAQETTNCNGCKMTCQEYTLAGDPAMIINSWDTPEYQIKDSDVRIEQANLTSRLDSFAIRIIITNLHGALDEGFEVSVTREWPNGETAVVKTQTFNSTVYKDTLQIYVPMGDPDLSPGTNYFTVSINSNNDISEHCYDNNSVTIEKVIYPDLLVPLSPCKFSIVNHEEKNITLFASTGLPFMDELPYEMEIALDESFDNPLAQTTFNSKGGVLSWQPEIDFVDNTVYFWRARRVPPPDSTIIWKTQSFLYKPGSYPGWNQSHIDQLNTAGLFHLYRDETDQQLKFPQKDNHIKFINGLSNIGNLKVSLNSEVIIDKTFLQNECKGGISFIVIEPELEANTWISKNSNNKGGCFGLGTYGNNHATVAEVSHIDFTSAVDSQMQAMVDFLQIIPDDYYVGVYSVDTHRIENLPAIYKTPLNNFLKSMGIDELNSLTNEEAFIAFGRKNNTGFNSLYKTSSTLFELESNFITRTGSGRIKSIPLGPSNNWEIAELSFSGMESQDSDEIIISIFGRNKNGDSLLMVQPYSTTIDISGIDANEFPFLWLEASVKDSINFTPAQLDYWRVYFERYSEWALNLNEHYTFYKDTIQRGQDVLMEWALTNAEQEVADSVMVHYQVTDADNKIIHSSDIMLKPLDIGETVIESFSLNTKDLSGLYTITVSVNPKDKPLEKFDFNNLFVQNFYVEGDVINPYIDVTFDGIHILNGDIIAPNPNIVVRIKDENIYLALNNPDDFELYLRSPDENGEPGQPVLLDWNEEGIIFTGANNQDAENGKNWARIEWNPNFLKDGKYELLVKAKDRTGNSFAKADYRIEFDIITKESVSNVFNYPNPFTSSTRFVFTLTGSEIPDFFKIQIMTVNGKVVKEITHAEIGTSLKIGHNITDYAWDGTDEFGNQLANGVYLYRVIIKNKGQELEQYELGDKADNLFKNGGWGKMYIMR